MKYVSGWYISYGRYSIHRRYSCVNCAFSYVWPSTRFGLMTFIRRAFRVGVDVLLVVDERNGNEGGVVQNDLGYGTYRWSGGEVVNSQHNRK